MNKRQMLLGGPGLDGYAYQADTYCVPCGQRIIENLPCEDYDDLNANDSEQVPQPIFFGEADYAQHCGECGEYIYGPSDIYGADMSAADREVYALAGGFDAEDADALTLAGEDA